MRVTVHGPVKPDPRRVSWDENDCERMTRGEFEALRCLIGATQYINTAKKYLEKRLESIPSGKPRMAMLQGSADAIAADIIGTMTYQQAKQMQNVMNDMEMRMVPKLTPMNTNVLMPVEAAEVLVSSAQHRCSLCTAYGEEARACELYKVLEALTPLDDYGSGVTFPYYQAEIKK